MKRTHNYFRESSRLKLTGFILIICMLMQLAINNNGFAQCKPIVKIDGNATVVNPNDDFGLNLPYWLKSSQTLQVGSSVSSISVIEFSENGTTLEYSKVIIIDASSTLIDGTVPSGKVWKIESIAKINNSSTYRSATFSAAGSYTWKVPACAEEICIDMWGGGGGGAAYFSSSVNSVGGGGGGGGFGSQCFAVTPGTSYTVVVGAGGKSGSTSGTNGTAGGSSSVSGPGINITVTGGGLGTSGNNGTGIGGAGGTSTLASNAQGASGSNGCTNTNYPCGGGGAGANGGAGGPAAVAYNSPGAGVEPGGGGAGGYDGGRGNAGAPGRVIISW